MLIQDLHNHENLRDAGYQFPRLTTTLPGHCYQKRF